MGKNGVKISVVVPLFNEEESLVELYEQLSKAVCSLEKPIEFLFVDDGSTDGSMQVLTELHKKDPQVRVVQFRRNYGKSAALGLGFKEARGELIVTLDADLQDEPHEIPKLVKKLEEGFDLVSGWKKIRNDPFIKKNTSKLFNFVTRKMTGLRIHDMNCGLKVYRREVTDTVNVYGQLHRFLPVLAQWQGFKVGEVVVKHSPRKYGKTKFGASRFIAGFLDLVTVLFITRYTKRPLHLFGLIGLSSFIVGVGISGYLAVERLFLGQYLSDRPLLFLGILAIVVGVQFVSIGLLGEMITESRKDNTDYSIKKTLG
ncbi:glycosyltransferase family 2 protein [candidate division KSB1 bacterium]|nr:glycosyltransferase family 2 protein [candidate division KSB1 bacterium]TDI94794.1 MAG: glycosyltransferase [Caldithrix sp.]TDI98615.1 MAG: glycosyltransferase [Caldithrix sp.]